jgi:DNA-binding transcriptional ArsR family regulator
LTELTRAINHPCRLRILEIHKQERGRSVSVGFLTSALAQTREYRDVTAATVSYHLSRLRDAHPLPEVDVDRSRDGLKALGRPSSACASNAGPGRAVLRSTLKSARTP